MLAICLHTIPSISCPSDEAAADITIAALLLLIFYLSKAFVSVLMRLHFFSGLLQEGLDEPYCS